VVGLHLEEYLTGKFIFITVIILFLIIFFINFCFVFCSNLLDIGLSPPKLSNRSLSRLKITPCSCGFLARTVLVPKKMESIYQLG
jgi:hypothetical protein